jgi:hypothetical protein
MRPLLRAVSIAALLALALTLLAACGTSGLLADPLADAEARWAAAGLSDYRYRLQVGCFCPPPLTEPVIVEVRGGAPSRITNAQSGVELPLKDFERYAGVPSLFELIRAAQQNGADKLEVAYDAVLGYPTRISVDYVEQATDDELSLLMSDLAPLSGQAGEPDAHLPVVVADGGAEAQAGVAFTLAGGARVSAPALGWELHFAEVLEDSRCPTSVNCAWSGRARIALSVRVDGQETSLTLGTMPEESRASFAGHTVELQALEPQPRDPGEVIPLASYRATLLISPE